jgi:hypothetical protein
MFDAPIRPCACVVLRFGPIVIYPDFLRLRLDLYQFRPDSDLIQIKVSFFNGFISRLKNHPAVEISGSVSRYTSYPRAPQLNASLGTRRCRSVCLVPIAAMDQNRFCAVETDDFAVTETGKVFSRVAALRFDIYLRQVKRRHSIAV